MYRKRSWQSDYDRSNKKIVSEIAILRLSTSKFNAKSSEIDAKMKDEIFEYLLIFLVQIVQK